MILTWRIASPQVCPSGVQDKTYKNNHISLYFSKNRDIKKALLLPDFTVSQ